MGATLSSAQCPFCLVGQAYGKAVALTGPLYRQYKTTTCIAIHEPTSGLRALTGTGGDRDKTCGSHDPCYLPHVLECNSSVKHR